MIVVVMVIVMTMESMVVEVKGCCSGSSNGNSDYGCSLVVVVVVCVRDDSLVVGWLCSRHPVPGGLRFRAISCWVGAILAVKQTVKSAWLLRSFPAAPSRAGETARR